MYFTMVGKLSLGKETEKFKPYEERTFDSGYKRKQLKFNVTCGDNIHFLTLTGGVDGNNKIYARTKDVKNENGETKSGKYIQIPFDKRLDPKTVNSIVEYGKYILDLEIPQRRSNLKKMLDDMKNEGRQPTTDKLAEVGLKSADELEEAYNKSCKKRHEYISAIDLIDALRKVIASDKYKDSKFYIKGNGEYSYYNGKSYSNYVPNRIYLAKDDAEEISQANIVLYFNKDSLDDTEEKCVVDGYMQEYNATFKKKVPVPTSVVIRPPASDDPMEKKRYEAIIKKFKVSDRKWYEYGILVDMLNGSQKTSITMDMLDDEQKEDIECGLITLDDVAAEMGDKVYGERIREYRFVKPNTGYTKGRKETAYTSDDFNIEEIIEEDLSLDDDDDDEI